MSSSAAFLYISKLQTASNPSNSDKIRLRLVAMDMNPEIPASSTDLTKRRCFSCRHLINIDDTYLSWDFLDFCNKACILCCNVTKCCMHCTAVVVEENYGRYLMQIAGKFYQFCTENCMKKYQSITNFCAYCEKSSMKRSANRWCSMQLEVNGSTISVSFCSAECLDKFNSMLRGNRGAKHSNATCLVCDSSDASIIVYFNTVAHYVCSLDCRLVFTSIQVKKGAGECLMCRNYFSKERLLIYFYQNVKHHFCSSNCKNVYKQLSKVHLNCSFCLNPSDNFSMIKRFCRIRGNHIFCSMNCLMLADTAECLPPMQLVNDETYKSAVKKTLVIVSSPKAPEQRNMITSCSTRQLNKSTSTDIVYADRTSQTNLSLKLIPVPVPIYVPIPSHTYNIPQPVPMPFPLPIPTPIFVPITQRSLDLLKDVGRLAGGLITDPLQAEMLQIADVLTEENQIDNIKETNEVSIWQAGVDFENELPDNVTEIIRKDHYAPPGGERRGKKRQEVQSCTSEPKRRSYMHYNSGNEEVNVVPVTDIHLDYNLGINAWKQWVTTVNYSNKNMNLQTDILRMCPEELNYALCLFIRDLRKPNGEMYAPDTIYYICLGIQFYLNCNGRMENLFYDNIFEMFTTCLDELARKFCCAYHDDSQFIVTRVEEEYLWETKQLGCYSPYVLLNTIIYFNTKYCHRSTVKQHINVSFFHMQRFYKKNNKSENLNLRYYNNQEDYEVENENILRCPMNLYEYYVSKCPENIKNSLTTFYLVPEKHSSCESPVWYTTQPLSEETVAVMLNRIKMVKEINIALING